MKIIPRRNFCICERLREKLETTGTGLVLPNEEGKDNYARYKIIYASEESEYRFGRKYARDISGEPIRDKDDNTIMFDGGFKVGDIVMCRQDYENKITLDGKKLYLLDAAYFSVLIEE